MAPRRGCARSDRKRARYPARPGPRGSRKTAAEPGTGRRKNTVPAQEEDGDTSPSGQWGGAATAALEKKGFPTMRTCCASIATPVGRGPRPAAEPDLRGGQPG